MSTDLAKIDISAAADALKDKIRSAFVELIPPEQWKAMIEAELRRFTAEKRSDYGTRSPSPFAEQCRSVLAKMTDEKIREVLNSPEWSAEWTGKVSERVKEILLERRDELIGTMLTSMMGAAMQSAVSSMVLAPRNY